MKELLHNLKYFKEQGMGITLRELKYRFIVRENQKKGLTKLCTMLNKYNVDFLFFIVADTIQKHPDYLKSIEALGHTIECHGFRHYRFDMMTLQEQIDDLNNCQEIFQQVFNRKSIGFRAPHLKFTDFTYQALKQTGFQYSSSVTIEDMDKNMNSDIEEIPIIFDDWMEIIVKNKQKPQQFYNELMNIKDNGIILLHPIRMAMKRFFNILEKFVDNPPVKIVSMSEYLETKQGIVLSGDIGELSIVELITRVFL